MKNRFPLHVHISALFLILILLVGSVISGLSYKTSRDILESTGSQLGARIGQETQRGFASLIGPAEMATRLLSLDGITQAGSLQTRLENLGFMREALRSSTELTSLYVGYENGDFFLVRRIWNDADRKAFDAPEQTAYIVQSIEHRGSFSYGRYIFLDSALSTLRSDDQPAYAASYDPRSRNWYQAAMKASGQIRTPPYVFFATHKIGISIANRAVNGKAIVGADIRLETLDQLLAGQKVTSGTQIVLVTRHGQALGYEDSAKAVRWPDGPSGKPVLATLAELGDPVLSQLLPIVQKMDSSRIENLILNLAGDEWRISIDPIQLDGVDPLFLITAIPDRELLADAYQLLHYLLMAMVFAILLAIPLTWGLARAISRPLRELAGEAEAIRHFEFSQPIKVKSLVLEVDDLAITLGSMKRTIRRFIEISAAVAEENDFDRLLPRLLSETLSAAEADAGILYLNENKNLVLASGFSSGGEALSASAAVVGLEVVGPLLTAALASRTARSARLVEADIDALGLAGALTVTGASHAIAVPLLNRQQNLVGAMLLLLHDEADVARLSFIEALSGSAAVSLETKELIRDQKLLFEGLIQLIAGAIDAKSPYTGGHCARVPELTKMLARAACDEVSGPYKDFQLNDEGWQAVHVAAWLHDCGKVTTPEYVVDKATKLETLYDRIHEVRMRFEVLKRDAEIACLKAVAAGEPQAAAHIQLAETLVQLDDDYTFLASCNEGGEFMADEKVARLQKIAARTWLRTLDDRIGLSHEEKVRKDRSPALDLPVVEQLLADKPEHRFERSPEDCMPADNKWGFRMPVPELLYNKGELYNLSIVRGTLSEEERYKINEHIVQTFIMLSQLPFPKHLRNVPEIAAGHHEKMDGTGYPRRLVREEMSPLARMMAIADIFEALTAVDRPYKKGKTISEAIKIMAFMKKDQHIDPDLFDLFLSSGVYRQYADRFLKPEQIDSVDVAVFVGTPASRAHQAF